MLSGRAGSFRLRPTIAVKAGPLRSRLPSSRINLHDVGCAMSQIQRLWTDEEGQDIAEYAVMLAVILAVVIGTIRLVGGNANNVFSRVASDIQ